VNREQRRRADRAHFSRVEEAQLRRLVYRAFALRGKPGFEDALRAIEDWHVETLPERLQRNAS
jgi:hypothetical protein